MKKILSLLAVLFYLHGAFAAVGLINPPLKASEIYLAVGKNGKMISLLDLSHVKIKDFETLRGERLKLLNRIQFKMTQRQLRNFINPDGTISKKYAERIFANPDDAPKGFHLGGFLLGFFLGGWIVGLIIPYLFHDANRERRINWAWAGFGLTVLIVIIIAVVWVAGGAK